jgi:methyltransferase (TIGR00027 family)
MMAISDRSGPGAWASLLCRKRFIDDELTAAARDGQDAVVIVGAGYDTRAYRVPGLADVAVWEVDLATNIAAKTQALQWCFNHTPPNVTLLAEDLEPGIWQKMAGSGFDAGMRTFFIWESVTMYLSEVTVRKTLQSLRTARSAVTWCSPTSAKTSSTDAKCMGHATPISVLRSSRGGGSSA